MSCWVVPSVAAELWGVPVQRILERLELGEIPSKNELGRLFVDVAPDSPRMESPRRAEPNSDAFGVVTSEEREALLSDDDEQTINLGDWREAREDANKRRRPPLAA